MTYKTTEFNAVTNEILERDATAEEIAHIEKMRKKRKVIDNETEARATQKAALLDRLGITEDEAKLLLA